MASPESYNTPCLLGAMDRLWFQRIVLFSEPTSSNKLPNSSSPDSQSSSSSSNSSYTDCSDDDVADESSLGVHESFSPTISPLPQNKNVGEHEKDKNEEEEKREEEDVTELIRPTRQRNVVTPIRRRMKRRIKLERTVSCKTAVELEQEEVKGFIDLGFNFEKDRITPKMMSVVPGLQQRLGAAGGGGRRRPYLSEAWVIKRPESPLLRLRMPRGVSAASISNHMKKHLKLWAKTVVYSAVGDE
ncbi:hypothetical protein V2J09_009450 [Rumex salicifolius]